MINKIDQLVAQNFSINLNQQWSFKAATPKPEKGLPDEWLAIDVPKLAHTALMEHGKIPDLFYRDNETKYQYLENEDFVFEKLFDVNAELLKHQHIELEFKGLDTYADVFLNGELVLKANNAFRSWKIDAKKYLREGKNYLRIFCYAAVKMDEISKELNGYALPGGPTNERVFSRKGQFNYGWDWGPRFVSCGIWRDVQFNVWDDYRLLEVNTHQLHLSDEKAILQTDVLVEADQAQKINLQLEVAGQVLTKAFEINAGTTILSFKDIVINAPKRWWSKGLGEPYLYTIKVKNEHQSLTQRIGLRSIELVRDKDAKGETFYFRLNGVPVFAKGANYIPLSIFQDKVTKQDYAKMINNAAQANMNMLRVWGGGIYEDDYFYDLCDEQGIMVWQDFMFACAMYPGNKDFLDNVEQEAIENVKRLRHHPCIALWCGNNEINEAWHNWGWQESLILYPKRKVEIWDNYKKVFNNILPNVVSVHSNGIAYWESSPSFGRYHEKSDLMGDSHYWGVWHDEEPFEQYAKRIPRFMSEYGFQSFPEWKTIETFTLPEDRGLETPIMTVHQKHPRGNTLMKKYMGREYVVPNSFEDFVYVSQIVQAEGMRRGIEAHRRAMPYCMGSLYWQLNDVWPVASWSGIDGLGRWKALHYVAREAFEPVLLSTVINDRQLSVHCINDKLSDIVDATLQIKVYDFYGNVIQQSDVAINTITANKSSVLAVKTLANLLSGKNTKETFAIIQLKRGNEIFAKRIIYFEYPKSLKLPKASISYQIQTIEKGYKVILQSNCLAKNVFIQTNALGSWSDNYFDLLPNEKREIIFIPEQGRLEDGFQIKSLTDTY